MTLQISYFRYEGAPGRYFKCERYGTMSTDSCSQNFGSAPAAAKEGRLGGCIKCPIGAQHHGGELAQAGKKQPGWCVRCRRSPEEYGGSGVSKVRLVTGGICVSCKNREYEVTKGLNAKGVAPKKWSGLGPAFTGVVTGDRVLVARERMAIDRLEVGLSAMRRNSLATALCWVSMGVLPALPRPVPVEQLSMFEAAGSGRAPLRAAPRRRLPTAIEQFALF